MRPRPSQRSLGEDWRDLRQRLAADRQRLADIYRSDASDPPLLWLFHPSYQCMVLHRHSRFLFLRGHRWLARLLWHANLLLTGADIGPRTDIGGGLFLVSTMGVGLAGKIGARCTICAQAGAGGAFVENPLDLGGGPGLPVIGDDVLLECGALVMGTITIGVGAVIGPRCLVDRDLPAGARVLAVEPRRLAKEPHHFVKLAKGQEPPPGPADLPDHG